MKAFLQINGFRPEEFDGKKGHVKYMNAVCVDIDPGGSFQALLFVRVPDGADWKFGDQIEGHMIDVREGFGGVKLARLENVVKAKKA